MAKKFKLKRLEGQSFIEVLETCKSNNVIVKRYPKDESKALKSFIVLDTFINVPKEFQNKDSKVDYNSLFECRLAISDNGNLRLSNVTETDVVSSLLAKAGK